VTNLFSSCDLSICKWFYSWETSF